MTIEELTALGLDEQQAGAVLEAIRAHEDTKTVRFTAPMGVDEAVTREQILSIPDRALRRAAIAENMNLFKGEN